MIFRYEQSHPFVTRERRQRKRLYLHTTLIF